MTADPGDVRIRDMTEADLEHMLRWLTDERVLTYYDGRDTHYDAVSIREDYMDPLPPDSYRKIAEYRGVPVGYIQIFFADEELREEYSYSGEGRAYAADMFIGEADQWNMGIGTAVMKELCRWLREDRRADAVILDPRKNNPRAIHMYGKCGFRQIGELPGHELHEGELCDCVLMELRFDNNV